METKEIHICRDFDVIYLILAKMPRSDYNSTDDIH